MSSTEINTDIFYKAGKTPYTETINSNSSINNNDSNSNSNSNIDGFKNNISVSENLFARSMESNKISRYGGSYKSSQLHSDLTDTFNLHNKLMNIHMGLIESDHLPLTNNSMTYSESTVNSNAELHPKINKIQKGGSKKRSRNRMKKKNIVREASISIPVNFSCTSDFSDAYNDTHIGGYNDNSHNNNNNDNVYNSISNAFSETSQTLLIKEPEEALSAEDSDSKSKTESSSPTQTSDDNSPNSNKKKEKTEFSATSITSNQKNSNTPQTETGNDSSSHSKRYKLVISSSSTDISDTDRYKNMYY